MIALENISNIILFTDSKEPPLDITNVVANVTFYQSIFEPFVTGSLTIVDVPTSRVTKKFEGGIVGKGEELAFTFKSVFSSKEITIKDYCIYSVKIMPLDSVENKSNPKQITVFEFCSKNMFKNEFHRISQSYNDKISEIVRQIGENVLSLQFDQVEETNRKYRVIVPSMTPAKAIYWLTSKAAPKANLYDVNYCFYETLEHKHNFVSLGTLFKQTPIIGKEESDGIVVMQMVEQNSFVRGNVFNPQTAKIANQHRTHKVDPFDHMKAGMFSATLLGFDLTRKTYSRQVLDYRTLFQNQSHLYDVGDGGKPIVQPFIETVLNECYDHPNTSIHYSARCSYLFDPIEARVGFNTPSNTAHEWYLARNASIEAILQTGVDIEIKGNTDIQIGNVVFFSRPQIDSIEKNLMNRDMYFNGKYVVTNIKHELSNNIDTLGFNLKTILTLRKESDPRFSNLDQQRRTP
jgi:hypothetical protein